MTQKEYSRRQFLTLISLVGASSSLNRSGYYEMPTTADISEGKKINFVLGAGLTALGLMTYLATRARSALARLTPLDERKINAEAMNGRVYPSRNK